MTLFQPVTCERCHKTYKTKGGWKYHVDNAVCDPNPPEPAYGELDDLSDAPDSDDDYGAGGKVRKRKAARKAAAVLAATAAATGDDSGEDGTGGGGGNASEGSSATVPSEEDDDDDDDDDDVDDGSSSSSDVDSGESAGDGKKRGNGKRGGRGRTAANKAERLGAAAGRPGGRGSGLTAGGYGAAAFTNGGLKSGPRFTGSAVKTSDLVISGQGLKSSATLVAPSHAEEGTKGKLASRLEHAQMRAVSKKARLAMDLEPGAWRKGTGASAKGKGRAGNAGGLAGNGRSGGADDADSDVEPQEEEWKRRSWREMPGFGPVAACPQGAGEAKASAPTWEVRE